MISKIILASKSEVRKKILNDNGIKCEVFPANVDEDLVKQSLLEENVIEGVKNNIFGTPQAIFSLFCSDIQNWFLFWGGWFFIFGGVFPHSLFPLSTAIKSLVISSQRLSPSSNSCSLLTTSNISVDLVFRDLL